MIDGKKVWVKAYGDMLTTPFSPPRSPDEPLALWEIAEIDEDYREIVNAIWATMIIKDRAKQTVEHQRIVDMLHTKSARCGMPLYIVSDATAVHRHSILHGSLTTANKY
jgi:hypothetical protein